MRKPLLLIPLLTYITNFCVAQVKPSAPPVIPEDTIPPVIRVEANEDSLRFSALLRPLRQVAGAPASFYSYFWELGDGAFSFDKSPVHAYKDTGTYQVRLYATNNYDDGKPPPTRPHPVKIKNRSDGNKAWASHFFHSNKNIEMKINRNPKPGEDFVALLGYRNQSVDNMGGSIVLFFNERQFKQQGFELAEKRTYHGEDSSSLNDIVAQLNEQQILNKNLLAGPAGSPYFTYADDKKMLLQTLQALYTQHSVLQFKPIQKGSEQFVFITMNTLPGMIQDTNATVTMTAMLLPENPALSPEVFELEMEVVASHDPNRLQLKKRRINYRFMGKKKELTYKIRFQNTGKGPAKKVAIGIAIPSQLNTQSIEIKSMSPACKWCDSAYARQSCIDTVRTTDSVYFVFKNIYLPGLQQEGVSDKDSTQGFVEYGIRFKKKPKKIPFTSQAAIIFDKNEPIYTNKCKAVFIKGVSPGIVAGYMFSSGGDALHSNKGPFRIGYTLSPYAPSRPYFQAEVYAGLFEKSEASTGVVKTQQRDTLVNGQIYLIAGRERKTITQRNLLQVVPLHFRYNVTPWMGVGIGAQATLSISEQKTTVDSIYLAVPQLPNVIITSAGKTEKNKTDWFAGATATPFIDLQFGLVKAGPLIGFRYLRELKGDTRNRFFAYAGFRL